MVDHKGTGQVIGKEKTEYTKKELDKKLGTWNQSNNGAEYRCSNPTALPSASDKEVKAVEKRIKRAKDNNRWIIVGEYGEEWHMIMLQAINGLSGMGKIHNTLSNDSTGAIRPLLGGEYVEVDDKSLFVDAIDKQMRRMSALRQYFGDYEVTRKGRPINPAVLDSIIEVQTGLDAILRMRRPSLTERIKFFVKGLFTREKVSKFTKYRDILIIGLENAGFEFKTESHAYVGEKYLFDEIVLYKGVPRKKKNNSKKKKKSNTKKKNSTNKKK